MWGHNKTNPSMLQAAFRDQPETPPDWSTGEEEINVDDL